MEVSYEQVTQRLQQAATFFSESKFDEACGELEAAMAALDALLIACTAAESSVEAAPADLAVLAAPQDGPAAAGSQPYAVRRIRPAATTAIAA